MATKGFIKNSLTYIGGTVLGGILGYLLHFVVSRKLSVVQYGEFQTLLSLFTILGVFGSALSYFIVSHTSVFASASDERAQREFIAWLGKRVTLFSFAGAAVLFLISPLIATFFRFSDIFGVIAIALTFLFSTSAALYLGSLNGWRKFGSINVANISGAFMKLVIGIALVFIYPRASLVIVSVSISGICTWYMAKLAMKRLYKKDLPALTDSSGWRKKYFPGLDMRKMIIGVFFYNLMVILLGNIDVLLVKFFSSPELTGYYSVLSLLGKIVVWVNSAVIAVVLPSACATSHAGKTINHRMLLMAYGLIVLISLSATGIYALAPNLMVSLLFGAKYTAVARELWRFGVLALLLSMLLFEANFAFARRDFRVIFILVGAVAFIMAGLGYYHDDIRSMTITMSAVLAAGYVCVFFFNFLRKKHCTLLPVLNSELAPTPPPLRVDSSQ